MNFLIVAIMVGIYMAGISIPIAGAVISRRAWKRNGWPEARMAFRAFAAIPALNLSVTAIYPILLWQFDHILTIDTYAALGLIFVLISGITMIAIAFALYRLARRSSRQSNSPSSPQTSEIPLTLS